MHLPTVLSEIESIQFQNKLLYKHVRKDAYLNIHEIKCPAIEDIIDNTCILNYIHNSCISMHDRCKPLFVSFESCNRCQSLNNSNHLLSLSKLVQDFFRG